MKVFLIGFNYASIINSLVYGFEENGVTCKAMTFEYKRSHYNRFEKVHCVYGKNPQGRIAFNYYRLLGLLRMIYLMLWCDVVHVYSDIFIFNNRWELALFRLLPKKKFVTFVGSEVRDPEITLKINPYFKYAWEDEKYEYREESKALSEMMQRKYSAAGFRLIVWDVYTYIKREFFDSYAIAPHASFNEQQLKPRDTIVPRVVKIVHSPSAPVAKGTRIVLAAIEELKARGITGFEFCVLQHISNDEYQRRIQECDIYLDQFIWGAYGVAAQQAMEYGKVVFCYLLEERIKVCYGPECPIVNANADNLADKLEYLIRNPEQLEIISERSRRYYLDMHQPGVVARKMLGIYNHKR